MQLKGPFQNEGRFTELMVLQEELKTMPFGEIWDAYCEKCGVPTDGNRLNSVLEYEQNVQLKRI